MKPIRLFKPYVSWLARIYALKVLMGTQLAEGPVVRCFEREFGQAMRKKNVIAVNSGTSALELAFELAGVGPGDEVITPVLTCTATNLPILHRGAKIVFADINEDLNISIEDVERKITDRTKAIVFVHFGGNSSGLGQLLVLAGRYGIRVIEDAAQVVGAGSLTWGAADFTCISLQAIKTLTAGDGGFLICRDDADAAKARRLRWFGYDRPLKQKLGDTDLLEAGYKYHMNDINAAIGLGNLRALMWTLKRRGRARKWYAEAFQKAGIKSGKVMLNPWLTILVHPKARQIDAYLKTCGIGSGPYHYRNDKYTVFGGRSSTHPETRVGPFEDMITSTVPNMDRLEEQYTLLPFHHSLTKKDVERVVACVAYSANRDESYSREDARKLEQEAIEKL